MIAALYVDRDTWRTCYASDAEEAAEIFRGAGLSGALKEIGTDNWIEY